MHGNSTRFKQQRGFTITQMVVTVAIIAIVSTVGVLGITTARAQYRLQSAARLFASYVEKARADSVRRHATPGNEASVEIFGEGTTSYQVTMDFGETGVETRTFQLESGIDFGTAAQKVTFDWRGRLTVPCPVTKSCVFQIESDFLKERIPVDVSGSGDITVDEQHFPDQLIPEVALSVVPDDVDHGTPTPTPVPTPDPAGTPPLDGGGGTDPVDGGGDPVDGGGDPTPSPSPTATPHGNGNGSDGNNGNGNGNSSPTPTPEASPNASPSPVIPQCVSTISPSELVLSQSVPGQTSGTATFTITNGTGVRTISAAQLGNGNSLDLDLSLLRIDGSGSSILIVTTKNGAGNRGVFTVEVSGSPSCGSSAKLKVTVSN